MALRVRGKDKIYHAYFRSTVCDADGQLRHVMRTVNLGTTSLLEARALEAELMLKNRQLRQSQRTVRAFKRMELIGAGQLDHLQHAQETYLPQPQATRARKRILLSDAIDLAAKYRPIKPFGQYCWKSFLRRISQKYFHEVTPEVAFNYLTTYYNNKSGKSYNNNLSALNQIFKILLFETGQDESPFGRIPMRENTPNHQRAFTEEECRSIIALAAEPWRTAFIISYYTGMRQKDAFNLRWSNIEGDKLTIIPAKTSAYKRAVRATIPQALLDYLATLPRHNDIVCGFVKRYNCRSGSQQRYFGELLKELNITASPPEIVNYNSIRDTYASRMVAGGIDLKLLGGSLRHTKEKQTLLYNTSTIPQAKLSEIFKDTLSVCQNVCQNEK